MISWGPLCVNEIPIGAFREMERFMSKKMRQFAAGLLALALCVCMSGAAAAAPYGDDEYADRKLRVGLAYAGNSTGALTAANLQNATGYGSGYRFGYYDGELNFVELGHTAQTAITMTKTQNLYVKGSTYYTEAPSGSYSVLGCYHLRMAGAFGSFEEAQAEAEQWRDGFVAWINGSYQVRSGSYAAHDAALQAAGQRGEGWSVDWTSAYSVNVVRTGSTEILFQFDGGSGLPLGVMPGEDGRSETITWFKGYKYYGGFRYERLDGGDLTVVNVVPLDTYLKGVVPYESNKLWPLETLKAQALCAKCYALCDINKHYKYHFDVCNTTDCQVYYGAGSGSISPSELSDQAVDQTRGIYVWYDGRVAQTFFCSSNGGASEDIKNVWGSSGYPYLCGVVDPYEADVADQAANYYWSRSFTKSDLTSLLRTKGYCVNTTVEHFEVSQWSPTGNALELKFTYANGRSNTFSTLGSSTSWLRSALGFAGRSVHFTIAGSGQNLPRGLPVNGGEQSLGTTEGAYVISGDGETGQLEGEPPYVITGNGEVLITGEPSTVPKDTFVINGTGWGHNIGYSQWGGYAMALRGFTCEEILEFYFPGVTVGPRG